MIVVYIVKVAVSWYNIPIKAQSPWRDAASACTRKRTTMRDANLYEQVDR